VNVNIEGVERLEWIEGEDRIPGYSREEGLTENYYG
jgi:hypothetical protein